MDHATYELLLDAYRRYGMSKLRCEQLLYQVLLSATHRVE
jgi:hypothetical protein